MEKSPFKYDPERPRTVLECERPSKVYAAAGLIFAGSVMFYNKRFFRVDNNLVNFAGFTLASVPVSYSYASYFFSSANIEAGMINNQQEQGQWTFDTLMLPYCSLLFHI